MGKPDRQRTYVARVRQLVREAKNQPCADCEVQYPFYVMDFDHRPDEIKLYVINKMPGRQGLDLVAQEIAKCDVVCSNCHRQRTHERYQPV